MPEQKPAEPEAKPEATPAMEPGKEATDKDKDEHFDVSEVPPVVTHHQITVDGKLLKYTATTGQASHQAPRRQD